MRHRKTDAHIATVRVSVPIDPMDHLTVLSASAAINGIQAHLPPGSTVEVLNSRFGRVDAPQIALPPPPQIDMMDALRGAMQEIKEQVLQPMPRAEPGPEANGYVGAGDGMDPPDSLRLIPRRA